MRNIDLKSEQAHRLKKLIGILGFRSARQLAIDIQTDPSQFGKIMRAEMRLPYQQAKKISEKYGVDIEWLMDGKGDLNIRTNVPHETKYAQNDVHSGVEEPQPPTSADDKIDLESLKSLIENNKILARAHEDLAIANRSLAEGNMKLINKITAGAEQENYEDVQTRLQAILELLFEVDDKKHFHSIEELAANFSNKIYRLLTAGKKKDIHSAMDR